MQVDRLAVDLQQQPAGLALWRIGAIWQCPMRRSPALAHGVELRGAVAASGVVLHLGADFVKEMPNS